MENILGLSAIQKMGKPPATPYLNTGKKEIYSLPNMKVDKTNRDV